MIVLVTAEVIVALVTHSHPSTQKHSSQPDFSRLIYRQLFTIITTATMQNENDLSKYSDGGKRSNKCEAKAVSECDGKAGKPSLR